MSQQLSDTLENLILPLISEDKDRIAKLVNNLASLERRLVIRDAFYYGYLIQKYENCLTLTQWVKLIGMSDEAKFQEALDWIRDYDHVIDASIRLENGCYNFTPELEQAIERHYISETSYYRLREIMPGTNISGEDFIRIINKFHPPKSKGQLVAVIAEAFKNLLGIDVQDGQTDLVKVLTGVAGDQKPWHLILCVFPHEGTLDKNAYNELIVEHLSLTQARFPMAKTLYIAPSVSGRQASHTNQLPNVYSMWDMHLVRLLHLIEHEMAIKEDERDARRHRLCLGFGQLLADNVPNSHAYLETQAINQLRLFFEGGDEILVCLRSLQPTNGIAAIFEILVEQCSDGTYQPLRLNGGKQGILKIPTGFEVRRYSKVVGYVYVSPDDDDKIESLIALNASYMFVDNTQLTEQNCAYHESIKGIVRNYQVQKSTGSKD